MLFTNSSIFKKYYVFLFFLFLVSATTFSQNWVSGWVYIENVKTGLVMDVQHDVKANGTTIWPYTLNYGRAQMFRFSENQIPDKYGEDARYILVYNNNGLSSDFYFSVKTPALKAQEAKPKKPSGSTFDKPVLVQSPSAEVAAQDKPISTKKILKNFVFSIEAKRELGNTSLSTIDNFSNASVQVHKQIWKILPVSGEADTYYIQSAHFDKKMVIEPLGSKVGGTLVLSSFTGADRQKWRILKTKPEKATDLILSNFEWEEDYIQSPLYKPWKWHYVQNIKGKLSWTNTNTADLTRQDILINAGSSADYESIPLEANKTNFTFKVKSTTPLKTKEHCFEIKGRSKWITENTVFSNELCKKPDFDEPTTPPPTQTGVSKLVITNCHNDKKSVRLWMYDLTVNDGAWKDHGSLNSQWQGSGCPAGSPKEITISDNHEYIFVAIDCGNSPPNEEQGSCHKYTSGRIQGNANGIAIPIDIS